MPIAPATTGALPIPTVAVGAPPMVFQQQQQAAAAETSDNEPDETAGKKMNFSPLSSCSFIFRSIRFNWSTKNWQIFVIYSEIKINWT